jgi:deferrochelatase/peroxidase EfeB
MSGQEKSHPTRRGFLAASAGLLAAGGPFGLVTAASSRQESAPAGADQARDIEPFWGAHQGGIVTTPQRHTYFAAFDVITTKREELIAILRDWTAAAARLSGGDTAQALNDAAGPPADSGEALNLAPARLTLTFGFGPGLFIRSGIDRFGLASQRPPALVDLPTFHGDQLIPEHTGGDLSVQACADDPQIAFHAVRQLARIASDAAQLRWAQTGFLPSVPPGQTPRNLMGFKDGSNNPSVNDPQAMDQFVWVGSEGPDWMRGGSYLVVRRIRMALEHWDRTNLDFQEQTIGRRKYSGAPLSGKNEFDPPDLDAADSAGNALIPDNSHVRLAAAASNDGSRILRRPYSFNDGANITTERWPPWRQGLEYDAGLLFVCYQRDPRTGFIKIFQNRAKLDMLNQFVTHTAGGLFACPAGVAQGQFIGHGLF